MEQEEAIQNSSKFSVVMYLVINIGATSADLEKMYGTQNAVSEFPFDPNNDKTIMKHLRPLLSPIPIHFKVGYPCFPKLEFILNF
jgi:hypothetical protein